ncbi:hypothetical protein KUF83_10705, partial [Streptomyces sp. BV286]|nr:hypothetical protein [Streptomyces sp. BV286]
MDYCDPCQRHLNGALACPGCGTSAEACREYAASLNDRENVDERDERGERDDPSDEGAEPEGGAGRRSGSRRRGSRG